MVVNWGSGGDRQRRGEVRHSLLAQQCQYLQASAVSWQIPLLKRWHGSLEVPGLTTLTFLVLVFVSPTADWLSPDPV